MVQRLVENVSDLRSDGHWLERPFISFLGVCAAHTQGDFDSAERYAVLSGELFADQVLVL